MYNFVQLRRSEIIIGMWLRHFDRLSDHSLSHRNIIDSVFLTGRTIVSYNYLMAAVVERSGSTEVAFMKKEFLNVQFCSAP
jgi:hypothetical protein